MDINTLTGILGGSIATLAIKEVLNQINKRQDFTRDLKRITYLKKLEKAEAAIAFYWTYLNKVVEMKKGLEVVNTAAHEMQNDKYDNDISIVQDILNLTGKVLNDLSSEKYLGINAVHLYFDLEDKMKWDEKDTGDLYKYLSETKSIDKEIEFWMDFHNKAQSAGRDEDADMFWKKAIDQLPSYIKSLQNFIDIIEKNRQASYAVVQSIKKQLKQY